MKNLILFSIFIFILSGCEKEELPLPALKNNNQTPIDTSSGENIVQKGALISKTVSIGADYSQQLWYDLGTNSVVKSNNRTIWDVAFDCRLNENLMYLNSSNNPTVAISNETDFNKLTSDSGLNYVHEHHSGKVDSMAIGNVKNMRKVMVINRGFTPKGKPLGKIKVQVTEVKDSEYHIRYADLNGSNQHTAVISKSPQYNKVAYSFSGNESIQIEPPKSAYDLCFTQYTYIFTVPPQAYSVNGAVLNPYNTEVGKVFDKDFSKITKEDAQNIFYSTNLDVIGHHWKNFNLQQNIYEIYTGKNYLIKDSDGNIYKLHFLDFYDENGTKGSPSFEYMRL